jgi:hypothetical protein
MSMRSDEVESEPDDEEDEEWRRAAYEQFLRDDSRKMLSTTKINEVRRVTLRRGVGRQRASPAAG